MALISLDIRMPRSFGSVVQTCSITVTARQLGRTQPAITLQLQRLEELIKTPLLRDEGRRQLLTDDGDFVLSYAKSILRFHDEMLQRLASPDVEGTVVLGTPDLYAAFVLPAILSRLRSNVSKLPRRRNCGRIDQTLRSQHDRIRHCRLAELDRSLVSAGRSDVRDGDRR